MPRRAPTCDASPLDEAEFTDLMRSFAPFEARPTLALAVSGGRDSRALALLARHWARRRRGRVVGLVVDHGLRPRSAAEAAQTRSWLRAHAIEAHVLPWRPATAPRSGLQAAARAARYRLLLGWCRRHGVLHLLTAHQADDQAETYVMRAARDSGPAGLAAMSGVVEFAEARLLRPLLTVPRARLTATLAARGQAWLDDPGNVDPRFARGRLRRDGLTMTRAAALRRAGKFAARRVGDDDRLAAAIAGCAMPHPLGAVLLDHDAWLTLPATLTAPVVASAIAMVAGAEYPPKRARTSRLVAAMRAIAPAPEHPPAGLTLGGCQLLWRAGGWLVVREPASIPTPVEDDSFGPGRWDGRFEIVAPGGAAGSVLPHAMAGALTRLGRVGWHNAWPATPGLPALVAALPAPSGRARLSPPAAEGGHFAVRSETSAYHHLVKVRFRPRRPLAAGPFFPCFGVAKSQIVKR